MSSPSMPSDRAVQSGDGGPTDVPDFVGAGVSVNPDRVGTEPLQATAEDDPAAPSATRPVRRRNSRRSTAGCYDTKGPEQETLVEIVRSGSDAPRKGWAARVEPDVAQKTPWVRLELKVISGFSISWGLAMGEAIVVAVTAWEHGPKLSEARER